MKAESDRQEAEIASVVGREQATELISENERFEHRLALQKRLDSLDGKLVYTTVEVSDVVGTPTGLLLSGEPVWRYWQSAVMVWYRLRGVSEDTIEGFSDGRKQVTCLGHASASAQEHPMIGVNILSEYESEIRFENIPLIIDINCKHAWLRM